MKEVYGKELENYQLSLYPNSTPNGMSVNDREKRVHAFKKYKEMEELAWIQSKLK